MLNNKMTAVALQLDDINITSQIACSSQLDSAVNWLFQKKQHAGSNDLFWAMARHGTQLKATLCDLDDVVILTKNRHQLKRVLKSVYRITEELGLKFAAAKTWLGRVSNGFTFLGYQIAVNGIKLAQGSLSRMMTKLLRRKEQGATKQRLVDYVNRWVLWATAGVSFIDAPLKLNIKIYPSKQRGYSFKLLNNEWLCCLCLIGG